MTDSTGADLEGKASRWMPKVDWVALAMAAVIVISLGRAFWTRLAPVARPDPPHVGKPIPPIRLHQLTTGEPMVWMTPRDRVCWLSFWSAAEPQAASDLAALESIWGKFRHRAHFAMLVGAVNLGDEARVASIVSRIKPGMPMGLVTQPSQVDYDADRGTMPMHLIIDSDGNVLAIARGRATSQLDRLAQTVARRLNELDPSGGARFAALPRPWRPVPEAGRSWAQERIFLESR